MEKVKDKMGKSSKHKYQESTSQTIEMYDLLKVEMPRGCVSVAAAYLEDAIRELLKSKCRLLCKSEDSISDKDLNKLFKNYESQFYNFASCIRLARAMSVISKSEEEMLQQFAHRRNEIIHEKGRKIITEEFIKDVARDLPGDMKSEIEEADHDEEQKLKFAWWAARLHSQIMDRTADNNKEAGYS